MEIDTTEFDKQILTYIDPQPLNDTLMCSNQHCDMVSCCLQKIEKVILDELKKQLKDFNYYVDNYEEEIIKEQLDNQKTISKINKKLDGLKKELRTALRNFNKEEIDYDEYTDLKKDINEEIDELKDFMYRAYTLEGLRDYLSQFSSEDIKRTFKELQNIVR